LGESKRATTCRRRQSWPARRSFEREVTSERIKDKIAASKRKGLWVGGPLPLGYDMKDGKITVVEHEAEQVSLIYRLAK
jgi:DNA invertase Pin-like site-specific DNA recombinase